MNQNVDDQGCLRARRSALKEQILSNNLSCFFEYDDIIFSKAEKTINMLQLKQSHLRFFIAVAELRSVSLAARKLHRSPSAVSMTITNLEAQLGRDLFEAEGKSRLTPFGQYVFDVASEQIGRFDRTADGIFAFSRNEIGRVDIASVPSFATHYLPGLLAGFIERIFLPALNQVLEKYQDGGHHQCQQCGAEGDTQALGPFIQHFRTFHVGAGAGVIQGQHNAHHGADKAQ